MHQNSRERRRQRRAGLKPAASKTVQSVQTRIAGALGAYLHRFPNPGAAALAGSLVCIVLGNAYLLWLVA